MARRSALFRLLTFPLVVTALSSNKHHRPPSSSTSCYGKSDLPSSTIATMGRSSFLSSVAASFSTIACISGCNKPALAFTPNEGLAAGPIRPDIATTVTSAKKVAYRSLSLDFGPDIAVPVAMWHPVAVDDASSDGNSGSSSGRLSSIPPAANAAESLPLLGSLASSSNNADAAVTYNHRISVQKIGQMLAGWDFIPSFASRDFTLQPTSRNAQVISGQSTPLPASGPVVLLAHGYLGSRFDLSHLAEELASQGFIVVSAEYPESLAASYPRIEGLDRTVITSKLLDTLKSEWQINAKSYGIVGHSLGCGTAINTGDDSWARVCIAGMPSQRNSPALFISSVNDGAVSLGRIRGALGSDYVLLDEASIRERKVGDDDASTNFPLKSALIFDRPDAPNHISFLAEGTNDAMIQLLSPLLPVAQTMGVPVLDFDKYQTSRDSRQTAEVLIPLVSSYLKQTMKVQ